METFPVGFFCLFFKTSITFLSFWIEYVLFAIILFDLASASQHPASLETGLGFVLHPSNLAILIMALTFLKQADLR